MDAPVIEQDVVLLLEACTAQLDAQVLEAVRAAAGGRVRFADGYVFQHLVDGPITVTELARRLGVSQQAVSKQVADLVERGLVLRRADPNDGRARLVAMSARGRRAVDAGRAARARIAGDLVDLLGQRRADALVDALARISTATGAVEAMRQRQLRPEAGR